MLIDHVSGLWLALQLIAAGFTLQLAVQHALRRRRMPSDRGAACFAAWAASLTVVLVSNALVFAASSRTIEAAVFVRSVAVCAAALLLLPTVAHVARQPMPRRAMAMVLAVTVVRVGLWVSTDLVYEHRVDAIGVPQFGPWLAPTSLPIVVIVAAVLIPISTRWPDRVERNAFLVGHVTAAVLVVAATLVRGVTGELLTGLWILPIAAALQAITARRSAISERRARDLTAQQAQIAHDLARSEERARLALESGQMAWYEYRPRTGELSCTPELVAMLAHGDDQGSGEAAIRELIAGATRAGSGVAEVAWGGERGPSRWLEATAHVRDEDEDPVVVGVVKDITLRKEAEADGLARILTDPLTGLPNRAALLAALDTQLAAGEPFALLVMDIDRFKDLNESVGHQFADRVIAALARRLAASLRPDDLLARLGGDEFAVIVRPPESGEPVARLTLAEIARPIELEGVSVRLTASIGLVEAPLDGDDGGTLLRRADAAMYRAKGRRRGSWSRPDGDGEAEATRRLALASQFEAAIASGQIRPYFQPTVVLADGSISTIEALARWLHPTEGAISPAEFVPLAEQYGFGRSLFLQILEGALSACSVWRHHGLARSVSVNVSPRTLADQSVVNDVARALSTARLPGDALVLEITEDAFIDEGEELLDTLAQLRQLGVRLAIDDFGTGYSSLSYLKRLPVQVLKLDQSFIRDLDVGTADESLVEMTIQVAHRLGLSVVAEGVEHESIIDVLRHHRCDVVQGFCICRPGDAPTITAWLRAWSSGKQALPAASPVSTRG